MKTFFKNLATWVLIGVVLKLFISGKDALTGRFFLESVLVLIPVCMIFLKNRREKISSWVMNLFIQIDKN